MILCYDSDRAGISAALKGAAIWENMGIENAEVRVARLPDGDDPDSLLNERENGGRCFRPPSIPPFPAWTSRSNCR